MCCNEGGRGQAGLVIRRGSRRDAVAASAFRLPPTLEPHCNPSRIAAEDRVGLRAPWLAAGRKPLAQG